MMARKHRGRGKPVHFDDGGYYSEAEARARNSAPSPPSDQIIPTKAWDQTVGGQHVQMYGPAPLSDEAAYAQMRQQNQQNLNIGALDPTYAAQVYGFSPEQVKAYNKLHSDYKTQTEGTGIVGKVTNAAKFEVDRMGNLIKGVAHDPTRLVTGVDPASTAVWNKALGANKKALVGQLGGATEDDFNRYEQANGFGSLGAARALSHSADAIAGMVGGAKAGQAISGALSPSGPAPSSAGALTSGGSGEGTSLGSGALSAADGANAGLEEIVVHGVAPGAGALSSGAGSLAAQFQNSLQQQGSKPQDDRSLGVKALDWVKKNPGLAIKLGQGAYNAVGGGGGTGVAKPSVNTGSSGESLPVVAYGRTKTPYTGDYTKYGMGPEHKFFTPVPKAAGGALSVGSSRAAPGRPSTFVSHGTGAGGREDNIDAKLSENEYVIDAETVALLGDGSPEAGAKKLDAMRASIRRHKGQALAKGQISPDAKAGALQYLAEGGRVGVLAALFKRKPKVDPNANLRAIKAKLDEAIAYRPPQKPDDVYFDDWARQVQNPRPPTQKADGGSVRPRQRASAAMDAQDEDFDRLVAMPRRKRQGALSEYESRMRVRVGDATHDIGTLPHWMARNRPGVK